MSYVLIPRIDPVLVYHGTGWDSSVARPTEFCVPLHPMAHCDRTDTWDSGIGHGTLCGTSQVIPSHPMGLIGIAATVPGTFGIPNVLMDICGQCWICVEDRAHASG